MARIVYTTQSDVDYVLEAVEQAGQYYHAGDRATARRILRHAKAESRALADVVDQVADAADLPL